MLMALLEWPDFDCAAAWLLRAMFWSLLTIEAVCFFFFIEPLNARIVCALSSKISCSLKTVSVRLMLLNDLLGLLKLCAELCDGLFHSVKL